MRFDRLLPALLSLLGTVSAQTVSGLTFDGRNSVSLVWAFDGETPGRYDFYLCAGDESTGSYVSRSARSALYSETCRTKLMDQTTIGISSTSHQ